MLPAMMCLLLIAVDAVVMHEDDCSSPVHDYVISNWGVIVMHFDERIQVFQN